MSAKTEKGGMFYFSFFKEKFNLSVLLGFYICLGIVYIFGLFITSDDPFYLEHICILSFIFISDKF